MRGMRRTTGHKCLANLLLHVATSLNSPRTSQYSLSPPPPLPLQDVHNLDETAGNLRSLSTTGGSGGVLDLFYPPWKLRLAQKPCFFSAISQLWAATYAATLPSTHHDEAPSPALPTHLDASNEEHDTNDGDPPKTVYAHPYGPFDPNQGYFYLDRTGFRVPDHISQRHTKGKRPLQRSLTPHLDCCPSALYSSDKQVKRWRPIQSFIALTDNHTPDTGGFECVKGWHRQFETWAQRRKPCGKTGKPAPCVGDFTPIRPEEDADVIARFAPVLYPAGSVVAFDWRIPHANAARHVGEAPRQVSYGSFLPDVPINRVYAQRQRERFLAGMQPDDQWKEDKDRKEVYVHGEGEDVFAFSERGLRLLGGGLEGTEVGEGVEGLGGDGGGEKEIVA